MWISLVWTLLFDNKSRHWNERDILMQNSDYIVSFTIRFNHFVLQSVFPLPSFNFFSESFPVNTINPPSRRSTFVPHCFTDPLWLDCDETDLIALQGPQNISMQPSLPRSLLTFSQHSLPRCISPSLKRHDFPDPSLHKFCLSPFAC